MAFIRFVLAKRHPDSAVEEGLFTLAYTLRDDPAVSAQDRGTLRDNLEWFERHLPTPHRFSRSKSKGYWRRKTRGIGWFRDGARQCLARMHLMKDILEAHGHQVTMVCKARVGFIVYEDDFQVVAEPFSDTRTG